jgi:hypothetical protein
MRHSPSSGKYKWNNSLIFVAGILHIPAHHFFENWKKGEECLGSTGKV